MAKFSGDPTSGATGTGAVSIADLGTQSAANSGNYFLGFSDEGNTAGATLSWNFGNGYFGTSAVSSAGTNASEHLVYLNTMCQQITNRYQQKD